MTVRNPLFINSDGDLQEMTDAQVVLHQQKAIYHYSLDPSALLTVVSNSGANMASIDDTRLQASVSTATGGDGSPGISGGDFSFDFSAGPASIVTVTFDKINFAYDTSHSNSADTNNRAYPIYLDSDGNIRSMTLQDMKDTFLHPAIDLMVVADSSADDPNVAGTYRIHTATSLSNFTEVSGSNTAIFTDTRADVSEYGPGYTVFAAEVRDQPETVTNFYLHRRNGSDVDTSSIKLLTLNSDGDIQQLTEVEGQNLIGEWLKETASSSTDGFKITYAIGESVSGTQRGSAITNLSLTTSNTTTSTVAGSDIYRAQVFPTGTATTQNTYLFKINKA